MRILCPRCNGAAPVVIEIAEDEEATQCPSCNRRFRIRTFWVQESAADYRTGGYVYRVLGNSDGVSVVERIPSAGPLAIKPGRTVTVVRRGNRVEGLADQSAETWMPVAAPAPRYPAWRQLGMALAWPVTILALLQALRFWSQAADLIRFHPAQAVVLFLLLASSALVPAAWWLLQSVFPDGPTGKRLIRGWKSPGLDD